MAFWSAVATFFKGIGTAWKAADTLQKISYVLSAVTAVVGVKGYLQARQMLAKGQDILANKTSAGGKIPVIYGTRRVGAQIIYMDVSNNDSRHLFVVYALSVGECDEILGRTIELDGNPITDPKRFRYGCYVGSDRNGETGYSGHRALNTVSQIGSTISAGAGGFGTSSTSRYRITFNLHHGEPTQSADPMLVASMPNWTSSHKLNGVCYIAAHYKYDKEGMFAGVPQLTVQVKGKRVYDPRDNTQTFGTPSTYKHSSNPALCFLDLITNNEYGKGLTASQLNMSTFSSAATVCDTKVDQPYFNGTAQSVTWSANSGDNFFTITGTGANDIWWQNKVDEVISIYDQNGDDVLTNKEITDIQRTNFFDTNQEFVIFINDYFSSNYSSVGGSTLLKVKRFHCNGYLDTNKNVMDNAKELLANMRGVFLYVDGQYELQIEDTGTSTFTITDDHIISDAGISVDYGNKDKKANKVIVEFFNANKKYELDTATVLHDATPEYYSDDGDEILEIKAEFPYVTDPYIAYNMAKAILTRSRNQTTMQFLGTPEMYKLNVGDIVTLAYTPLGFTGKISRVEALELQPNGLVAVSLIEYFDVYTWEVPPQEPVEEQSNPPSAYAVKAPTGLSFTDSDSSATGRPILSWNAPTDYPDYEFRVNVVDSSGNQLMNRIVNTTEAELNFTPTGNNYVASITSLNTLGTESDPVTLTFNLTTEPVAEGDIRANAITANKIDVNELSAISADLGTIDAGSMNIGSGNFTVSSAGVMTATGATIGGSFSAGSGNNIFKADSDGIYLGNATFANAPFKVLNTGAVQTTLSFTAGVAGTDAVAKMSGSGDYRFWSGNETPANASFSVDKDGKAVARNLVLKLTDGTVYFDSETGFSSSAISQISAVTGTKVNTISSTFDADTEYEEITVTANTTVNLSVSIDTNFGGTYGSSTENTAIDEAEAKVPENFTLTIEHSSDGGSSYSTVVTDTFTRVNDRANPKTTPASDEYKINTFTDRIYISGGGGVIHLATTTTSFNLGCVDSDGRTVLSYTGLSLTGTTSGTTHRIRATVSTTDTSYDSTNNNVSSTAPRVVSVTDPSGNGFYVDDGSGSTVPPEGDITRVQITTAASSGLTGGANYTSGDALFTLALASSIDGAKTFTNNVVIQGDLDVQGTTTTIDTTNLDVKDKNITLNYGTGDTSANANGSGITIQDAVSAGNDATLTWNTSNDSFNFSHNLNFADSVKAQFGTGNDLQIYHTGLNSVITDTGIGDLKIRANNLLLEAYATEDDYLTAIDGGAVTIFYDGSPKLATSSTGIDVTGNVTATAFYGDGSNLTGVTSTTINNNADNRIITGSGTENTLNAESNLTYDGTGLGIGTASVSSGYLLHLKSTGDAAILLEADTDNVTETDNPRIQFSQDGGIVQGRIGYTGGANTFEVINQYNDSLILGQNNLARLTLTATDGLFDVNVNTTSGHGYQINGQTVIDSSRNLTNIGTINSGAITSSGNIITTSSSAVIQTPRISMEADGTLDWGSSRQYGTLTWDTNKAIIVGKVNTSLEFKTNNSGLALTLDTSQNATFEGTINSGAITSTGDISGATIEGYTFPSYPSQSGGLLRSDTSGNLDWTFNTVSSYVDSGDDRVVTSTGSTGIQGEYGLTYNRTDGLQIHNYDGTGGLTSTATLTLGQSTNNSGISQLILDSQSQGSIRFKDGTTIDASISYNGVSPNKLSISCSNGVTFGSSNLETTGTISANATASSSAPKYTFTGDTDTGLGYITTNAVGLIAGGSRKFYVNATGAFFQNLSNGVDVTSLKVSGTQVIDSSRNLTNIGTINSGAITSSGYGVFTNGNIDPDSFTSYAGGIGNIADGGGWAARGLFVHGGGTGDAAAIAHNGGNLYFGIQNGSSANSMSTYMMVSPAKAISMTDAASVALPNTTAGTINSGAITISNGNQLKVYRSGDSAYVGLYMDTGENAILFNSWGSKYLTLTRDGDLKLTNTTFLDSSRNLTNIGTGSFAGNVMVNAGSSYPLQVSSTQRYQLQIRNPNNTTNSGYGWWLAHDTNFNFALHADGAADRFTLTRAGDATFAGNIIGNDIKAAGSGGLSLQTDEGTKRIEITDGGTVDIKNASLRIGTTTVIDSSRNLTNIGTIEATSIDVTGAFVDSAVNRGIKFDTASMKPSNGSGGDADNHIDLGTSSARFKNLHLSGTISSGSITSSGTLIVGAGTQSVAGDADITVREGNAFAGIDLKSTRTSGNIGGLRSYNSSNSIVNELLLRVDGSINIVNSNGLQVNNSTVIDGSRNLANIGTITQTGTVSLNSYSTSDPDSTSRTRYPAGQMLTHYSEANGVSIIGGQGGYTGCSLTIGEETGRTSNFKLIRGISDTNGTPSEEFYIDGVGNAAFAGTLSSGGSLNTGAITTSGDFVMTKSQPYVVIQNTTEDGGGIVFNDYQAGAWPAASSQQFRITYNSGSQSLVMGHDNDGYAGFNFDLGGVLTCSGNITAFSDERLKENIQTLDGKKALQMRGVSFVKDGVKGSGVIAQEIEEIAPELVITANDEIGTKSVAYGNLVGYLIEAIKDQQQQIDELKARLDNDS